MTKKYVSAPLPFVGQKRMFARPFRDILTHFADDTTFVDLFGGSGLLSYFTRQAKPSARVIYNDFDNFRQRLSAIPRTNALLARIRAITADLPRSKPILDPYRTAILDIIEQEERTAGYVDYITLSSSLLFSPKCALSLESLRREKLWNTVRRSDYQAEGYLDGIEVVSMDYRQLFEMYKDVPNVVFLIDPPYLSTDCSTYTMSWRLADYLDVLQVLKAHRYVYFTSNKSSIVELCEWMGANPTIGNPFNGAKKVEFQAQLNYNSKYTDIMLYKTH